MSQRIEEIEINFDMTTKTLRHSSNKPNTEEHIKKFISDYEALSYKELGEIYGAAPRTLRDWANSFGAKKIKGKSCLIVTEEINKDASYEELVEFYKLNNKLFGVKEHKEEFVEITTDFPVALVFTADWHLGSPGVDIDSFDKDMKTILYTDDIYCYIGGDAVENLIEPSKIGSSHNQMPIVSQKALLTRTLEMLLPKIIALGTGNHSYWSALATGDDDLAKLAKQLKILYTGHGGLLNLKIGDIIYKVFRVHKSRFSSTLNPTHGVKQLWRTGEYDFDIGVCEHQHLVACEVFYGHGEEKLALRTGSYKIYDDYAMRNGFFGVRPENPTVVLYPSKKKMVGFLHMEEAIEFLGKV